MLKTSSGDASVMNKPSAQIFDHVDISKDTMKEDYNAVYWDKRYTVRESQIPVFLSHQADVILTTGVYVCVCSFSSSPCSSTDTHILSSISFTLLAIFVVRSL